MKSYRHTIMLLIREIECRMYDIDPTSLDREDSEDSGLQLLHTAYTALWKYHNMQEAMRMTQWKEHRIWEGKQYDTKGSATETTNDVCLDKRNVIQFKRRAV